MNTINAEAIGSVADRLEAWSEAERSAADAMRGDRKASTSDRLRHENAAINYRALAKRLRAALRGASCYCGYAGVETCDYCAKLRTVSA
jgi:hypothetical protein